MVDLGPEINGLEGFQLRMRKVTIEPGGVFGPVHDHKGRPGTVYVLQGTITDHRDGIATDYGPGVGWPEDRNTLHWLETGARFRRSRSRSMSSGQSSRRANALASAQEHRREASPQAIPPSRLVEEPHRARGVRQRGQSRLVQGCQQQPDRDTD